MHLCERLTVFLRKFFTVSLSRTEFGGDFSESVTIKRCGYEFLFKITGYERNSLHGFKIIEPDALPHIPDDEVLGRVVCLTVQLDDPA